MCIVGTPDMCAPTGILTPVWPTFRGHKGQNVKIQFLVNQGGTNRNRCTHRCVHRPTNEPWSHSKNYAILTYFIGQNRPPKKVGVNRHFQASWASQPMWCWLYVEGIITMIIQNRLFGNNSGKPKSFSLHMTLQGHVGLGGILLCKLLAPSAKLAQNGGEKTVFS